MPDRWPDRSLEMDDEGLVDVVVVEHADADGRFEPCGHILSGECPEGLEDEWQLLVLQYLDGRSHHEAGHYAWLTAKAFSRN